MDPLLRGTLVKLAIPLFVIALVLVVSRRRGIDWDQGLGLNRPRARDLMVWVGVWAVWVAISEWLINTLGMDQAKAWPDYPATIVALRILAIGIAGPVSEELVMRGLVFDRVSRSRLGQKGAIVLCAVAWSLMHVQYGWKTLILIAIDGLILGVARVRSRSVTVPIVMHVLGNLFSIAQSLHR